MLLTSIFINALICLLILNFQWRENKTVVYLILLIILFNVKQLAGLLINSYQNEDILVNILFTSDPFTYLIGPLILYYFKSLIQGKFIFDYKLIIFSLPILLFLMNSFHNYQLPVEEKLNIIRSIKQHRYTLNFPYRHVLFFSFKIQTQLILISNLLYLIYSICYYLIEKKANRIKAKNIRFINSNIFFIFISVFIGLMLLIYSSYKASKFSMTSDNSSEYFYLFTIVTPISFLLFPKLIYGINSNSTLFHFFQNLFQSTDERVAEVSDSSSDRDRILQYIALQKPYLQTNFSLHTLSHELNIPHLRVSSCFNKEIKTAFPEYRNRKRIEHAVQLFQANIHHKMSIEGIALQCGFKNKSSFYLAFKAEYKMTPSEWISKNL